MAFVGEQPGKQEIFKRKPFVGSSGQELNEDMHAANIIRSYCYLTNVFKDLDNYLSSYCAYNKGTYFITPKGKPHIDELREELAGCSANIFVAVGGVALYALTGLSGIMKWRGSIVESNLLPGRKVIGILHPATVIPPKNVYLNKYLIIRDLQKARVESEDSRIHRLNRSIAIGPSFLDVKHWLAMIYDKGKKYGKIDWYDIELYNEELACISFGWNEFNCISIPFIGPNGDYFSIEQEAEIMAFLAKIMEDPSIEKGGQNIVFDSHFLLRRYGIKAKNLHDTMIAQRILFPEFPIGLDFIASTYTTIPYYKDEGKRWRKLSGDWNKLWTYNANDSLACAEAFPKQRYDLERQGNLETYERQRKLIEPLTYMMERGIRIDLDGMAKEKLKLEARVVENQERLNSIVGFDLNPNSPTQVKNYFYNIKGHPPYKKWDAVNML
jgi:DNA polymerase